MIIVFGSINMDIIFTPEHAPAAGETVLLKDYASLPGGKGANQAVAAAKAGSNACLAGCVGQDGFGDELLNFIADRNVDVTMTKRGAARTGTAVITVSADGENRIMVAAGANLEASADQIPQTLLCKGNTLLMQMETDPQQIERLAKAAAGRMDRVILNLAPAIPVSQDTLRALDYLILNEIEIQQLSNHLGKPAGRDITATAHDIAKEYGLICIVTIGSKGAYAVSPDGGITKANAVNIPYVVDTTGAGDAFCGALAAALDENRSLDESLTFACAAGSLACLKQGAMISYPEKEDIRKALQTGQSHNIQTPKPFPSP